MKILLPVLIISFIAYYLVLYFFVFRSSWQAMFFYRHRKVQDIATTTTTKIFDAAELLGKSSTTAILPIQHSTIAEPSEIELDIPVEYEVEQEENIENLDAESIELEEQGFTELSTGLTYDELQLVVDVVQNEEATVETKAEAGNIVSNIGQTDMFELLLQFSNGQQRVDDLLKKHVDKVENNNADNFQLGFFA